MKPLSEKTEDLLERGMADGVKAMRDYLTYQGNDKRFLERAKVGAALASAWVKARASESNRMQVELIATRVVNLEPKQLTE